MFKLKLLNFLFIISNNYQCPLNKFCIRMFHSQIITEIISLVGTKERADQILLISKKNFDLHQFNITSLYPKDVRKMHQSLKRRYKKKEIQVLPTNWNQGERRLFVWFIVCFLHLKKISVENITQKDLQSLSGVFYGKAPIFLDFQLKNLPKTCKSKRQWTPEEDNLLKKAINQLKEQSEDTRLFNNWNDVAKIIFFQTDRQVFKTPKACRERWYNHVDDTKKKDEFSLDQDLILLNHILSESKSWSKIVKILGHTRTQHRIKNRYYTLIRKYQRANGTLQPLTEELQMSIVLKIKTILQSKTENRQNQAESMQNKNPQKIQAKIEQIQAEFNEQSEKQMRQESSEKENIKNNAENIKDQIKAESNTLITSQKLKILQENQMSEKSSNQISLDFEKQNSKGSTIQNQQILKIQNTQISFDQTYLNQFQYFPTNFMYNPVQTFVQQSPGQPIIVNQFYCPIFLPPNTSFPYY